MLKKTYRLFLGLVAIAGSACVTPTHVSSAFLQENAIIITHIQAGGVSASKEELVIIYNNSSQDIDITNWCFVNKGEVSFACFTPVAMDDGGIGHHILSPYGHAVVASSAYVNKNVETRAAEFYSLIYESSDASSGSIVGSSDSISVVDEKRGIVANKSWTSSITAGKALTRLKIITGDLDIYATTSEVSDWSIAQIDTALMPFSWVWYMGYPPDDDSQEGNSSEDDNNPEIPDEESPSDNQDEPPSTAANPIITELLPNPVGADLGSEFIEIYNPGTGELSLDSYKIQIGFVNSKFYSFPVGSILQPKEYKAFYNTSGDFTLVNTAGWVQLIIDEDSIGLPIEYTSPKDGQSWSLVGEMWQYSALPTPGAANGLISPSTESKKSFDPPAATSAKPCAEGQYRHPETNRCRQVSVASSEPAPCKAGQERNPETNRCRNTALATKTLTPCKEGQERNLETNRCRNVSSMTKADHGILGVQTVPANQPSWYYWGAIALIVVLVLGYAAWEWREELRTAWSRITAIMRI